MYIVKNCCVFNCNEKYDEANKVQIFRLSRDETERNRWLAAIPRDNISDTDETIVCERHWLENYSKVFVFGKPLPANPPSVFPGIPKSQIPTQANLPRTTKKTSSESRNVIPDESSAFNEKGTISSFEELAQQA